MEDRRFELTTSLSVPLMSPASLDDYVGALERAVRHAVADMPAITAYFVAADHTAVEIVMGLRFEKLEPRYIEEMATEVLETAVAEVSGDVGHKPVREESSLIPA